MILEALDLAAIIQRPLNDDAQSYAYDYYEATGFCLADDGNTGYPNACGCSGELRETR